MEKKKLGKIVEKLEGTRYEMSDETAFVTKFYLPLPNSGYFGGMNGIYQRWEDGRISATVALDVIIEILNSGQPLDVEYLIELRDKIKAMK
jgi:hypothetical protein